MTEKELENCIKDLSEKQELLQILIKCDLNKINMLTTKKVQIEFLEPLRKGNKRNIDLLYKKEYGIPKESINLLKQVFMTLKNIHKLLNKKDIVDANALTRSCFENLVMAMMIIFDENVYAEFKNLSITDETREYTKIQSLRNKFKSKLKQIDKELFDEISNTKLQNILDDIYNKLCLYTHSTLIVNLMVEIKNNGDEDIIIIATKQNVYFLEILLYICLKYLTKDEKYHIDYKYAVLGFLQIFTTIDKNKYNEDFAKKYKDIIYSDLNKEFLEKNNKEVALIQKESNELKKVIEENPIAIIELLKEIVK